MIRTTRAIPLAAFLVFVAGAGGTLAESGHSHGEPEHHGHGEPEHHGGADANETMRKLHEGHEHKHDFEAMEEMPAEERDRVIGLMRDIGLALPPMDSGHGRALFVEKGCVVCHSVNGVGADIGPSLDAARMPSPMNAFEFAAGMWRGAAVMTAMQEAELGGVIDLTAQDLADLTAFAHDAEEQKKLTLHQVPAEFRDRLEQ